MFFWKKQLEWTLEVGFFLTFAIFVFHGPWIMHWVIWNILSVKAITPSILIRFSKFWCLNISAFQDLAFSYPEHPRGMCPRGQKHVLKVLQEKPKSQKLKKNLLPGSIPAVFFSKNHLFILNKLDLAFNNVKPNDLYFVPD